MEEIKEDKTANQWIEMNRYYKIYKLATILSVSLNFIFCISFTMLINDNPVVVLVDEKQERTFLKGSKQELKVSHVDLEKTITDFVKARYEWDSFDPGLIIKKVTPFVTEGYREKLIQVLGKIEHKNKKGQSIEQYIANIKPSVNQEALSASFQKVIVINGQPIAVPVSLTFHIIDSKRTTLNPLGLYINGVIESDVH